jgi:hypothetical protein
MKSMLFAASLGIILSVITTLFAVEEITTTEFSSGGFKITKVMSTPKKLNALGKMSQFTDSNDVGKHTELSKDLFPEEQGEEFIINWKYSGATATSLILRLEYITGKNSEVRFYEKSYTSVKSGSFELVLKNLGDTYNRNGEIAHWKVSLVSGNKILASRESRMWGAFQTYSKNVTNKETPTSVEK